MTSNHQPHLPPLPYPPLTPRLLGISSEAVEKLAYLIYVENGSVDGRTFENWAEAERRLMAEYLPRPAVRRVPATATSETKSVRKTKKTPAAEAPAPAEKKRARGAKPKTDRN
jgi:hypothetical protein